jgi:hypothetical protein
MSAKPVVYDEEHRTYVRVDTLVSRDEWWVMRGDRAAIAKRFPGAIYMMPLPLDCVWDQPSERGLDLDDARNIKRRVKHEAACRRSLATFLNSKLRELDGMVRTGWWILARARVRISIFESRP